MIYFLWLSLVLILSYCSQTFIFHQFVGSNFILFGKTILQSLPSKNMERENSTIFTQNHSPNSVFILLKINQHENNEKYIQTKFEKRNRKTKNNFQMFQASRCICGDHCMSIDA
jgi:hypothetical protein